MKSVRLLVITSRPERARLAHAWRLAWRRGPYFSCHFSRSQRMQCRLLIRSSDWPVVPWACPRGHSLPRLYLLVSNAGIFVSDRIAGAGVPSGWTSFVSDIIEGKLSCTSGVQSSPFMSDSIAETPSFVSDTFADRVCGGVTALVAGVSSFMSDTI